MECISEVGGGSVPGSSIPGYGLQLTGTDSEMMAKLLKRKMNVVMGDGRPVTFKPGMPIELFKALLTRDGGEVIDNDRFQEFTERQR